MAHTPGPLTINGPSTGIGPYDDGGDYAILDTQGHIIGETFYIINEGINADAKANAKLFAAAPDLLAACKLALKLLEIRQIDVLFPEDTNKIRHALAKAERGQ